MAKMPNRHLIVEMTSPEFAHRVASGAVVIIPTGAVEQHGPHLPLGVDCMLPAAIALDVARVVDGLVAPVIPFGYKSMPRSGGGPFFPGTIGLDAQSLSNVLRDVIRELVRHDVRKICILDGHYENLWFLNEGVDLAMRELSDTGLRVMRLQHWDFLNDETLKAVFPDGFMGIELEHAAVLETSLMMHYHPHLVREDMIPDNPPARSGSYDVWPAHRSWVPASGALVSAQGASARSGAIIARQYTRDIAAALCTEFDLGTVL